MLNSFLADLFPESPRWLHSRGREEEAALVLARLHSRHNDVNSPLIQLELEELNDRIGFDAADKRFWDFRPIFRGPGAWYRVGLNALVSVGGQLSGNGLITCQSFAETMLEDRLLNLFFSRLLDDPPSPSGHYQPEPHFDIELCQLDHLFCWSFDVSTNDRRRWSPTLTTPLFSGCAVVDRVGRRKLMLFGQISAMIGMAVVAGLLSPAGKQDVMRANAGIVFIYLFM